MRFEISRKRIGDFQFIWEYDSGLACGAEVIVFVKGPELEFSRVFYFEENDENYIHRFCEQFARDEEYRKACLDGTADWVHLSDLYELNEAQLSRQYEFRFPDFLGYLAGDKKAEQRHERVHERFEKDAHRLYQFLRTNLNRIINNEVYQQCQTMKAIHQIVYHYPHSPIDERMSLVVHRLNQLPGVKTVFSCQGVSHWLKVKGRRVLLPDGHSAFAHVAFQGCPDDLLAQLKAAVGSLGSTTYWLGQTRLEARNAWDNLDFCLRLNEFVAKMPDMPTYDGIAAPK